MKNVVYMCFIMCFQSCINEQPKELDFGLVKTFKEKNDEYNKKYFYLSSVKFENDSAFKFTNFFVIHKANNNTEISNVERLVLVNNCSIDNGKLYFNFNPRGSNLMGEEDVYLLIVENLKYKFSSGYYETHDRKYRKKDRTILKDLVLNKMKFNIGDTVYGIFSVDRIVKYDNLNIDSFTVYGEIRAIVN